jgi:GNAT superfamily N-acetyltransferase
VAVRRVPSEEWETLRAVRLRALQDSPEAFSSSLAEEIDRPDSWWKDGTQHLAWFVAEEDGQVVGLVAGMPFGDIPEVISMWVEPERRGTGVADELLAVVVTWAKSEAATGLSLAVAQDNHRAGRFYERAGFAPTGPGEALRSRPDVCTTEMRLTF